MQKDKEFSRAFNDEPITDEVAGNAVGESAAEGNSDAGSSAVVIDAESAVANAAEDAGLPTGDEGAAPAGGEAAEMGEVAPGGDIAAEAAAEGDPVADEAAEQDALSPEDMQRQKSWEGRLKKREEELAAREAAVGGNGQPGETDDAEIAELIKRASADFGEDFVSMICKIAAHEANKAIGSGVDDKLNPINQTIQQAINDVHEAFQNMHFSAIADAHENFREIIDSPEFDTYLKSLPTEQQSAATAVLEDGTPKQVIKLLTDYQNSLEQGASNAGPDASVDDALDAAEGVRGSAPVQLPERVPVGDDDEYKAAWNAM